MTRVRALTLQTLACGALVAACSRTPPEPTPRPDASPAPEPSSAKAMTSTTAAELPRAFPEAEGFGAYARGGRGGEACLVTTLASSGPGSLSECVAKPEARFVLFRVSGVIAGPVTIRNGRLTIAGQTSPGGITLTGGIACDNSTPGNDCNDLVIQHVRLRGGNAPLLQISRAHTIVVDHCSFSSGADELVSIRESQDLTIQYSMLAEPAGPLNREHGMVIEGSTHEFPLDRITLHHNVFDGVSSHVPKIACDASAPGSDCAGHRLHLELTNNVFWEADRPIGFERCTQPPLGNACALTPTDLNVDLNLRGNLMVRRGHSPVDAPLVEPSVWASGNDVFYEANRLQRGVAIRPATGDRPSRHARHDFPYVAMTPNEILMSSAVAEVGPLPRDATDTRFASHLSRLVDLIDREKEREDGGVKLRPDSKPAEAAKDSDDDGLPDAWERAHRLDPQKKDAHLIAGHGDGGSEIPGCKQGLSALECFLHELAVRR